MVDQYSVRAGALGVLPQAARASLTRLYLRSPKNFRYLAVALICAIINNLLLIGLVKAGFNYLVGVVLAYVPMVLFGYALHVGITFRISGSPRGLVRYALVMLANYPLWIASLFVLYNSLKLPIAVAAFVGTVITFVGNYLATHWAIVNSIRAVFDSVSAKDTRTVDQNLLLQFLSEYAFQPATALWRAIELPPLMRLEVPGGRGIDLGCGEGKLTGILLSCIGAREVIGVDPDPRETREAEYRGIYARVHTCSGSQIPESDASFDFAISNSVLEHIPELDPVLAETARLLRPDGIFLLTVPHAGFHKLLRGPLLPGVTRAEYESRLDTRLAHLRYPSTAAWQEMLDRHGFSIEGTLYYLDRRQVRRWETISRLTAGVLSALSGGRLHPITLQRSLGLRRIQNRRVLPRTLATVLAAALSLGLHELSDDLTEKNTGCVAIRCRRRH